MRAAADALAVTPGAVSQRIRDLEILLGYRLLSRSPKGVELTRAGKRLFEKISEPLREIEFAYGIASRRGQSQRISLTTTPSFATNWLVEQ